MNFPGIQFQPQVTESLMGLVKKQLNVSEQLKGRVQGYGKTVTGAWKGGDADAFVEAIATKFVPAIARLIAAIAGFGGQMGQATSVMTGADQKATGLINNLGDLASKIYK